MEKRILFFALLSCISLLLYGVTFVSSQNTGDSNPIILEGDLKTGSLRSCSDAVSAEVQGNIIMILFHKDVGNLLITLTNDMGNTVYDATVNTSVQQQAFIPLSGLPSGIYTITFSNGSGALWGDFEI